MSGQARNEEQLKRLLMPKIKEAVNLLVQKIWNENRELVRTIVYEAYSPKEYNRTNQFKEAWETDVKTVDNVVEGSFKYDPRELDVVPGTGQHSSIIDDSAMTTYLADIIYQGLVGDFTGKYKYAKNNPAFGGATWTKSRNAWKELEDRLTRVKLKRWMEECFKRVGLNVKSYGASWSITK